MRCLFLSLALIPSTLTINEAPTPAPMGKVIIGDPVVVEDHAAKEEKCLATMVYGEARGEPHIGQVAVAYTAVNRARNRSVCDVVLAPKQYSIFNDNPALRAAAMSLDVEPKHKNYVDQQAWPKAVAVAKAVLQRKVPDPTKGSTHYLAPAAMEALGFTYPKWSEQYTLVTVIAGHKFYKPFYPKKEKKSVVASI
jgi:spore germination cell wall hydrolase CwlJ-like protein